MGVTVGIDLGTTYSLCTVFREGRPRLVPNALGEELTPSAVGALDDGRLVVGSAAIELRVTRPRAVVTAFKRWMGTDRRERVGPHDLSAPEFSSLVLRSLKQDAEAWLGAPVDRAVITVPAYFNEHQRRATKLAGELAGLEVLRTLNEPTAAALAYGLQGREGERRVLVFDLGGGTFDVTLLEVFEGNLEIIATSGDGHLGGEDFTGRLVAWVLRERGLQVEAEEHQHPLRVSRLWRGCEAAKRGLAGEGRVEVCVPGEAGDLDPASPRVAVERDRFEALTADLMERLEAPLQRALRDGGCRAEDLHEVILVGGATRMPAVQRLVRSRFGREPLCSIDPDRVVALGAAVQAALILDDPAVRDMVVTDVCPHSLGIEIVKLLGGRAREGYFLPVIRRNTTLPVSREEVVATVEPNQRQMLVKVYQGEARRVEDNLPLGSLTVEGLPPAPAGTAVCVRFTYDLNGILDVEAYVPSTERYYRTVLTQHVKGLDPKQVREAVRRLQAIKFYPRDDLANRRLVLVGERVVGELPPGERDELEAALDAFEDSMGSGDRGYFERARGALLDTLSRLGFPCDEPPGDARAR